MTTIAWDGYVLAGDTLANGSFKRYTNKVFTIRPNVYFSGCGYLEDCMAVVAWLKSEEKDKPKLEENFAGILIEDGKPYRLEQKLIKLPIKEEYHAVGSGAGHAIVALYLGQDAVAAVKIAAMFDTDTSADVTYINICDPIVE